MKSLIPTSFITLTTESQQGVATDYPNPSASWAGRVLIVLSCLLLLSASSAQAAIFAGTYTGVTAAGSTLNGDAIPVGTPFNVTALFSEEFSTPEACVSSEAL